MDDQSPFIYLPDKTPYIITGLLGDDVFRIQYLLQSHLNDLIEATTNSEHQYDHSFLIQGIDACIQIDQFCDENPVHYKKYLEELLKSYLVTQEFQNQHLILWQKKTGLSIRELAEKDKPFVLEFFLVGRSIGYIIEHLTELLNFETETQAQPQEISHRQIALIYQYENKVITEINAKSILTEFGIKISPTSNKALANCYRKFNTPNQRTGQGVNTANDICKILPFLSETAKTKALSELETAKVNQSKIKYK